MKTGVIFAFVLGASLMVGAFTGLIAVRLGAVENGYSLYQLQHQKAQLLQEADKLELEVSALKRPDHLEKVAARLGLKAPRPDQVIRAVDFLEKAQP